VQLGRDEDVDYDFYEWAASEAKAEARHQSVPERSVTLLGALLIGIACLQGLGPTNRRTMAFWNFGLVDSRTRTGMTILRARNRQVGAACPPGNNAPSPPPIRRQQLICTPRSAPDAGKR